MTLLRHTLTTLLWMTLLALSLNSKESSATTSCEVDYPINFAGMSWDSNLIVADIQRFILENGYGCKTDIIPTETLTALSGLERGDIHVKAEVWLNSLGILWDESLARGQVTKSGDLYSGYEAWFIPKYTQERYPELQRAADLANFKSVFQDPEQTDKGRFYSCPAGWNCEIVSENLFKALALDDDFVHYPSGSIAAQRAAVLSAYRRQQDIVFYHWSPTPLVSSLELVALEFPPYDEEKHKCLTDANCAQPEATAYPENPVFIALNKAFAQSAPELKRFFDRNTIPLEAIGAALVELEESGSDSMTTAQWFLRQYPDVWTQWVPADVAERVKQAL